MEITALHAKESVGQLYRQLDDELDEEKDDELELVFVQNGSFCLTPSRHLVLTRCWNSSHPDTHSFDPSSPLQSIPHPPLHQHLHGSLRIESGRGHFCAMGNEVEERGR